MSDEIAAINKRRQEWIAVVNAGDVETYMSLLTSDVVWLPPDLHAISGRDAIRVWLQPFFDRFDYEFSLTDVRHRVAGKWAVEHGVFTSKMSPKLSGEPMEYSGRYIVLWRRGDDGVWSIERYIDDTDELSSAQEGSSF